VPFGANVIDGTREFTAKEAPFTTPEARDPRMSREPGSQPAQFL
jgi:hypothetical protein